ncbi:platelet-derived growth factor receptor-like protein [Protopterus annectens]|uniref:platelet-derived growth factor receptor-like protein n=1 Tax=Protopterus annectens TaxID=7888 RepID=UPI001CF9AED8|nr:platelet-derived growth factor receptor-like protein [Protopterus annectens]
MNVGLILLLFCSVMLYELDKCQAKDKKPKPSLKKKLTVKENAPNKKPAKQPAKSSKPMIPKPDPSVFPTQPPTTTTTTAPQIDFSMTQVVEHGKFLKVTDTTVVQAGKTLELRCKGKPIHWRYPPYLEEEDEGRLRIKHFGKYSQMVLVNSTAADTGEYSCLLKQCDGAVCRNEEGSIKTFVFFTDPQELFVPTEDYYEVVHLRSHRTTTLPCQVTTPLAKVTLHREFPPEEILVDGSDISYNVKKGFTIHRPRPLYAGTLFCMASYHGLQQISTKYVLIYVNYPASRPAASVEASMNSVRAGANFNVTCTVYGELDIDIDFTWDYPGQKLGRPPYTRESSDTVRRGGQTLQRSESVLFVDEARAVDDGQYTCTAKNLQGSTVVSTHVRILPPIPGPRGR